MKAFGAILVLFAVASIAICVDPEYPAGRRSRAHWLNGLWTMMIPPGVDEFLDQIDHICPDTFSKEISEAMSEVGKCKQETLDGDMTMCNKIRHVAINCTSKLQQVYEKCMPATGQDVPKRIVEVVTSAVNHVCESKAEVSFELANRCFYGFRKENQQQVNEYLEHINENFKAFGKDPTFKNFCRFIQDTKDDVENHVKRACETEKTRTAVMGIYEAAMKPCNDVNEIK